MIAVATPHDRHALDARWRWWWYYSERPYARAYKNRAIVGREMHDKAHFNGRLL